MSEQKKGHSRRDFLLNTGTLAPAMAVGSTAMGALSLPLATQAAETPATPQQARAYQPNWFTAEEFAFITAAVARLIPSDERGPGALEAGVPEFIDRQMIIVATPDRSPPPDALVSAIAIQPDGKIVAAGSAGDPGSFFVKLMPAPALVRYNQDGTLDRGFGTRGNLCRSAGRDRPNRVATGWEDRRALGK